MISLSSSIPVLRSMKRISDNMEIEIAKYLDQVSDSHLSDETKAKIRAMLREISEIESIGDSCFNIARTLNRRIRGKEDFIRFSVRAHASDDGAYRQCPHPDEHHPRRS